MSSRRRRRDRRGRRSDHPDPAPPRPTPKRTDPRRRAEFEARMARLRRTRSVIGLLGFIPLVASLFCFGFLCDVPRELYLVIWAAVFGTFLGLTIRMWRERRAFERAAAAT